MEQLQVEDLRTFSTYTPTVLETAVRNDDPLAVKLLVSTGADTNVHNQFGKTPLHVAVEGSYMKALASLLDVGCNTEMVDWEERTPLFRAAELNKPDCIRMLLDSRADPYPKAKGLTALHITARNGHLESVAALLRQKLDINVRDDSGETALLMAVRGYHPTIVEELLKAGADHSVSISTGTALHLASDAGHADIVRILLSAGADLEAQNSSGSHPLHLATGMVIEQLVASGANVNIRDNAGETPLFKAVSRCSVADVRSLLIAGADVNSANHLGMTPLTIAAWNGACRSSSYLISAEPDVGHLNMIRLLLDNGADPAITARSVRACCWCNCIAARTSSYKGNNKIADLLRSRKT